MSNLTPEELQTAGKLLYGERWQADLARALGYEPRRLRQWLEVGKKSHRPIPPGTREKIIKLLEKRNKEIQEELLRLGITKIKI